MSDQQRTGQDEIPNDAAAREAAENAAWDQIQSEREGKDTGGGQNHNDGAGELDDDRNNDTSADDTDGDRGPAADQQKGKGQAPDAGDGGATGGSDQDGQEADPWASAPEPLRAEYETLKKQRAGQDAKIQRLVQALDRANRQTRTSPQTAGQGGAGADARPKGFSSEQWKRLQDELPEVADAFKEEMAARDAELEQLRGTVGGLSEAEAERQAAANYEALKGEHQDLEQVLASPDWLSWVQTQPAKIRAIFDENRDAIVDPEAASTMIKLFKADHPRAAGTGAGPGAAPDQSRQAAGGGQGTGANLPGKRDRQRETAAPGPRSGAGRVVDTTPGPNASEDDAFEHFNRDYVKRTRATG